jgi:hypothetical protein
MKYGPWVESPAFLSPEPQSYPARNHGFNWVRNLGCQPASAANAPAR